MSSLGARGSNPMSAAPIYALANTHSWPSGFRVEEVQKGKRKITRIISCFQPIKELVRFGVVQEDGVRVCAAQKNFPTGPQRFLFVCNSIDYFIRWELDLLEESKHPRKKDLSHLWEILKPPPEPPFAHIGSFEFSKTDCYCIACVIIGIIAFACAIATLAAYPCPIN